MTRFLDVSINIDINKLADQLLKLAGPLASKVWGIYIRQQYVEGFQNLISMVIWLALAIALIVWVKVQLWQWAHDYKYEDARNDGVAWLAPGFGLAFAGVFIIIAVINVMFAAQHFINPEYGAIQEILQNAKP